MEVTIAQNDLARCLMATQNIVERKTTMPILVNVLITASADRLSISATDLETTAVATVAAQVHSFGSTTVNTKMFAEIVRELPSGEVKLKLHPGERLEIISNNSSLRLIGVSAEEFPALPGMAMQVGGRIGARQLLEMINKSIYAASLDETRFNLTGVCFEKIVDGRGKGAISLRLIATDGHRLAMITRGVEDIKLDQSVIIPRKGLLELKKILDIYSDQEIGFAIEEGFCLVETPREKISMRLIDGEFPDYNQVIPKGDGEQVVVNSRQLADALKRVALMVADKGKGVRLEFSGNLLRISSSSPELGEAEEEMDVKYGGEPLAIGFNARYVIDIVSALADEGELCIELNGKTGPTKFYAVGDRSAIAVLMPMRIAD